MGTPITCCAAGQDPGSNLGWGHSMYSHCEQPHPWEALADGISDKTGFSFLTGGLGKMTEIGSYEVWLCVEDHACGDPWFCLVYHEESKVFIPWAENSLLGLVE